VTFAASATGCGLSPQYQFWLYTPGAGWAIVKDFGTLGAQWSTSFGTAGLYYVHVFARPITGGGEAQTQISYSVTSAGGCTGASLSADAFPPITAGTTVTLTATASGCSSPLYRFWRLDPGGGWTMVQDYSATATYAWNTTGLANGTYSFAV
jgi:hypothetical protein